MLPRKPGFLDRAGRLVQTALENPDRIPELADEALGEAEQLAETVSDGARRGREAGRIAREASAAIFEVLTRPGRQSSSPPDPPAKGPRRPR
jgi:hypothetical protein